MNKYPSIKYLVFDLDDTLLRKDRTISTHTIDVLSSVQKRGLKIVFNTSRSRQNSKRYIDIIHPDYGIYNGGCEIVDKDNNILFSRTLPKGVVKELTKFLNQVCDKISVQSKDSFYASDKDYKAQNAIWTDFSNGLEVEAYKILCSSSDHEFIKEIAQKNDLELQNYLNGNWNRLSIKGANKFSGILEFLKIVNGSLEQVAAFGDDIGDIEMIEKCGVGVAMKNSQKEVLKIAKNITLTNDEDGCANFIEKNIL